MVEASEEIDKAASTKPHGRPCEGPSATVRRERAGTVALILAANCAKFRRQNGLTRLQLAAVAGLNPKTVANMEQAAVSPRVAQVEMVAKALSVQPYELLRP